MPIEVESADGMVHEFPEGTEQSVIDQAMKTYAQQTPQQGEQKPPTWGETGIEALRAIPSGLARGIAGVAGLPGTAQAAGKALGQYIGGKFRGEEKGPAPTEIPAPPAGLPDISLSAPTGTDVTGQIAKAYPDINFAPQSFTGRALQTGFEMAPTVPLGGAGLRFGKYGGQLAADVARYALAPGAAAQAATELAPQGWETPAAIGAALLAPSVAGRVISPLRLSGEQKSMEAALRARGIQPTPGQVSGSGFWEGLGGSKKTAGQQLEQFTSQALSPIGLKASRLEQGVDELGRPKSFTKRVQEIGQQFDDVSARNTLHPDPVLSQELNDTVRDYTTGVFGKSIRNKVLAAKKDIDSLFQIGPMPGKDYQALRSRLAKAAKTDDSGALREITESLDDAMERSIAKTNPADAGLFPTVRKQYRNLRVLEEAAANPEVAKSGGLIPPEVLASAAKRVFGKRAVVRGEDVFSPFTTPAVQLGVGKLPEEWTAGKFLSEHGPGYALGTIAGGLYGSEYGPSPGTEQSVRDLLMGGPIVAGLAGIGRGLTRPALRVPRIQQYGTNVMVPKGPLSKEALQRATMAGILAKPKREEAPTSP